MRILQINKFHWVKGGAERYYFDLQRELAARGHEVAVFAAADPRNEPSRWSEFFAPHADYHGASPLKAYRLARDVIANREAARRLDRLLEHFKPQVAHLHNIHHQLSPAILDPLARRGVPVVQTLHDYKWVCPAYLFHSRGEICTRCGPGARFLPVVRRRCLHGSLAKSLVAAVELTRSWRRGDPSRIAAFLAPSRFLLERVKEHGLPSAPLRHVPYFLRAEAFVPAETPGEGMLYLGRLAKEKGLPLLLEALSGAAGVALRVAGTGPLEAELRATAAARALPIEFLGHLEGEKLHAAVRAARAVVVPSEWYENLPYAVLEAMALGVPVIGSRIGGIPELIADGVTGRLVPAGDAPAFRAAMVDLAGDAAKAASYGRAGRERLVSLWDAGAGVAAIESIYAELSGA